MVGNCLTAWIEVGQNLTSDSDHGGPEMVRLRDNIRPDDEHYAFGDATKYITQSNRYGVHCAECGELYYVDQAIMRRIKSAHEGDPSELAFRCFDCEEEYAEEETGR